MSAVEIKKDDVVKLYRQLSQVEVGQINLSQMGDWVKDNKVPYSAKTLTENFQLLHKVARKSNENQFLDFVLSGEVPEIKLTAKEMEVIKGGLTPWVPYAIYAGGYLLYDFFGRR